MKKVVVVSLIEKDKQEDLDVMILKIVNQKMKKKLKKMIKKKNNLQFQKVILIGLMKKRKKIMKEKKWIIIVMKMGEIYIKKRKLIKKDINNYQINLMNFDFVLVILL